MYVPKILKFRQWKLKARCLTLKKFLEKHGLEELKIKPPFLEANLKLQDADKKAAWELYVELLTRVTTQPLSPNTGDEKTALDSIFAIFGLTRTVLKNNRKCVEFTKIAVIVLNQIIRSFTSKWHRIYEKTKFEHESDCQQFRKELEVLQGKLSRYTQLLADMAGVEDLTQLEKTNKVK